ncbi:hypothetical protein GPECTOR_1g347 [Gonium pectorale]|uniref:Uncharacterized protein n=1 Tax=Gonium pectorale TaxID=33097 RepID=A0A150H2U2_GONPE|nr:hypothetical protein GPECTOR_1g347 [Gonium pectorale]|eukprot:KXZ56391.1 hypothetical protein GPECTOR_1g347 [Gonium pectorale]
MISELGKVQQAMGLGGYLSAFPKEFFNRIHKIIAGLVDAYELGGQAEALPMAVRMVAYHWNRTQAVIQSKGRDHWNAVLNCEFGGMNEILYRLYRITREPTHLEFAKLFNKPQFREPMEQGHDVLPGLHANTHLAQVAGFAEAYDAVGDEGARTATLKFFNIVTGHHSFATGGSNDHEFWQEPDRMASAIWKQKDAVETQETCTQYDILKIARSLFRWTGNASFADFYERALLNGILGTARLPPEDWPEHALPHRHGDGAHHHHHHHVNHLRSLVTAGGEGAAQGGPGAGAGEGPGAGAVIVSPHRRQHNEEWLQWWAFAKPQPEWNASDAHGPGVFLYLLPMGTGQSKSDNIHHWGFPFHSFWCCYGTVVESYAKLADSIYFKDMQPLQSGADSSSPKLPPRLYINQMVSSRATWAEMGLRITMEADMLAPGPAATADIRLESLSSNSAGGGAGGSPRGFTLMVRVPHWARAHGGGARKASAGSREGININVNGQLWASCPGPPQPGSYCQVTRQWSPGDTVALRMPMRWWLKPLPENRPQYHGLQAIMMGPFVMAGITHVERRLVLPPAGAEAASAAVGARTAPPHDLHGRVYPPEEADELLTLTAGWNSSLAVRHDSQLLYVSALEDGGDAMDATFRLGRGCHHGHGPGQASSSSSSSHHGLLSLLHGSGEDESAGSETSSHGSLSGAFSSLHSLMRLGQHDSGQQLSLESMSYPNHYIAYDHTDVLVLQPGSSRSADAPFAPCSRALWMMRPGLDDASRVLCRKSCNWCKATASALRLRQRPANSPAFAAASSFRLSPPARRAYPAGSYVLAGLNRHYLLAPLGNLVDERYTAYFMTENGAEAAQA